MTSRRTNNGWLIKQAKQWSSDQRIIISKRPIEAVRPTEQLEPRTGSKPKGLWYAAGAEWVEWCRSEEPQWLDDIRYCYELRVAPGRVLSMSTPQQLEEFTKAFSVPDKILASAADMIAKHDKVVDWKLSTERQFGFGMAIDWKIISEHYGAVEIIPYCWDCRLDGIASHWYYGWDIASGCCWDPAVVTSLELLAAKP